MLHNLCVEGVEQSHHLALMALKLITGMLAVVPDAASHHQSAYLTGTGVISSLSWFAG